MPVLSPIWNVVKKKKVWIPLLIVVIIVVGVVRQRNQNSKPQYTTETVKRQDLQQTVSATGTVKAAEEVDLNFKTVGRLAWVGVKVGDVVKAGQRLAAQALVDAESALLTASANLKSAQASLDKLRAGAAAPDIAVYQSAVLTAQTALDNTTAAQKQAVANALGQLLGLPATASPASGNLSTATLAVSGTYLGDQTGTYVVRIDDGTSPLYSVAGLETVGRLPGSRTTPTPLGSRGLKLQWSASGTLGNGDSWTIEVPNQSSTSYAAFEAAYEAALATQKQVVEAAQRALADAQAKLTQVQAPARSYDIAAAEAAVESARGAVLQAQAVLADRTILAPVDGTITRVNNQVGETTSPASPVLVLLAAGSHEVKVQVPESDIAKLKVGQAADMTIDAFGSSEHFAGHISFIDPASTVISDVVYYEVTVLFDGVDDRIKPGMTANVDVVSAAVKNVLVVPLRAVKYGSHNKPYVQLLGQGDTVASQDVTLGLKGDDGLAEVKTGLSEGQQVITFTKKGS